MGWRILIPIAGSAGIIYSVTGASSAEQRPELPAHTQPTHQWEAEVDDIEAKFACNSSKNEFRDATLSWKVSLSKEELSELLQKEKVINKKVEMKLVSKSGAEIFPKQFTGLRALRSSAGSSLSVYYNKPSESSDGRTMAIEQGKYDREQLVCAWIGLEKKGEFELYREGIQLGRNGLFVDSDSESKKLDLNIKIGECKNVDGDPKKVQCNLKVITEGAHLDWSEKVSAKVRLELK